MGLLKSIMLMKLCMVKCIFWSYSLKGQILILKFIHGIITLMRFKIALIKNKISMNLIGLVGLTMILSSF